MPDVVDEIAAVVDPEVPITEGQKAAIRRFLEETRRDPIPPELALRVWRLWSGGDAR